MKIDVKPIEKCLLRTTSALADLNGERVDDLCLRVMGGVVEDLQDATSEAYNLWQDMERVCLEQEKGDGKGS